MSSIGDPFPLASYDFKPGQSSKSVDNVYIHHHNTGSGSVDGYTTVAAQGDGVHILDLSALHPSSSHLLGPTTSFACPAITVTRSGKSRTYAVIESSPDINPDEAGRTVWVWEDDLTSGDGGSKDKKTYVTSSRISRIHALPSLHSHLLLVSPSGAQTLADEDLTPLFQSETLPPSDESHVLVKSFIYSRSEVDFVPGNTDTIMLLFLRRGAELRVKIEAVSESDGISMLGECVLQLENSDIVDISCSSSGYFSILTRPGTWHALSLSIPNSSTVLSPSTLPLQLNPSITSSPPAVLALTSSHVLLASASPSSSEIVLLIWDIRYSVLLAESTIPIPSALDSHSSLKLRLTAGSKGQALLTLSPASSATSKDQSKKKGLKSSILVVPYRVPETSTIAGALGRAQAGKRWLKQQDGEDHVIGKTTGSEALDAKRRALLSTMKEAIGRGNTGAADNAWSKWVGEGKECRLSFAFVKAVLRTVLQPSKPATLPYSNKVVLWLLERRAVTANMVEGGLLRVLRIRIDWQSIQLAFRHVIDLAESDIVQLLQSVVSSHRQQQTSKKDPSSIQVDSTTSALAVPAIVSLIVSYKTSAPALRQAIKMHLHEGQDLLAVLEVIEGWIGRWANKDVKLLEEAKQDEKGTWILVAGGKDKRKADLPPHDKILKFLQSILDASFLTILSHPPCHKLLKKIHGYLEPEVAFIDVVEQLRSPLEPFVKAQKKATESKKDQGQQHQGEWRRKKKQAREMAGMAVGVYQVEELVL